MSEKHKKLLITHSSVVGIIYNNNIIILYITGTT